MSKYRDGEVTIKEAIERMLSLYKLNAKMDHTRVQEVWGEILGEPIVNHTRKIYMKGGKLYVKMDSAVVRQELLFARSSIRERLNERMGHAAVEEIVFL